MVVLVALPSIYADSVLLDFLKPVKKTVLKVLLKRFIIKNHGNYKTNVNENTL